MDNLPIDICYQVLSLAMQEEGAVEFFSKNLPVELIDEYGKGHGEVYRALVSFYEKTGLDPVDPVAFKQWISTETTIPDAMGGEDQLEEYFSEVSAVTPTNMRSAVALARFYVNKERRIEKIRELNVIVEDDEENRERTNALLKEIELLNRSEADPLKAVYDGQMIADDADALWDLPDFLPTPFKSLNIAMGYSEESGFCKGAVHGILAQSGHGKSTFAKTLMNHWVSEGHNVLFLNYEEAKAHWERVLFTQITKQNVYLAHTLSDLQKKHYTELFKSTMENWNGRFRVKHNPETPYFEDMESWVREVASKGHVFDVLVIDTIQSMYMRNGKGLQRWQQFELMMVGLERLAKDLGCVIIITAQENANRMKEKREVVQQSDAGGSLTIIQKCAITIFITEARLAANDDAIDETIMQLQIPKNRITGTAAKMNPPLVRYNDTIKSYEDFKVPDGDGYDATIDAGSLVQPY